jgi:hypothetical protein
MADPQPKGERGQEHARKPALVPRRTGRGVRGARVTRRKLDCLKPNLQKVQVNARRKDARNRRRLVRQGEQ